MTARNLMTIFCGALAALAVTAAARATEPNNTPGSATTLPAGQLSVTDSLDGNQGRPDTILGHFNASFSTLLGSDDNSSSMGNGQASEMLAVPLASNGSAYFQITGAADTSFIKNHTQAGRYSITLNVRDPLGNLVPDKSLIEYEDVVPHELDGVWINPSPAMPGYANWNGFTVDAIINNIVGPGTGDSLDFFTFTGFQAFEPFTVELTNAQFAGLIGWYSDANNLLGVSNPGDAIPTLSGVADSAGNVKIGVTGIGDFSFLGEHAQVGTYTLAIVPEPTAALAMATGGILLGWYGTRRRRRRSKRGESVF